MRDFDQWFNERRQRELDQFKVGTEVVVTLHGECKPYILHGEREIGVRGIVVSTDDDSRGRDHPIRVLFRHPLSPIFRSSAYAPGELRVFNMLTDIAWTDEERAELEAAADARSDTGEGMG